MARCGKYGLIRNASDVLRRCQIDKATGCWIWQGATIGSNRTPAIWTFDAEKGEKRTMSGPRAVWTLVFGAPPVGGKMVYRRCCTNLCLNPRHLDTGTKADIGEHLRRVGLLRGKPLAPGSARNYLRLLEARGMRPTPPELVRAVKSAPKEVTGKALALTLGLTESTVSAIRTGKRWRAVS